MNIGELVFATLEDKAAHDGKRLAMTDVYRRLWGSIYYYEPTDEMRKLEDRLEAIKDDMKHAYGFLTLRPPNKYTTGDIHTDNFKHVVDCIKDKIWVKKIITSRWETTMTDGVPHVHWHCLFLKGRRCSKSTIKQCLMRGRHNYLWAEGGGQFSIDFEPINKRDKARVAAYVTKDDRLKVAIASSDDEDVASVSDDRARAASVADA